MSRCSASEDEACHAHCRGLTESGLDFGHEWWMGWLEWYEKKGVGDRDYHKDFVGMRLEEEWCGERDRTMKSLLHGRRK